MTSNFWSYEPVSSYRLRQAEQFRREYLQAGANLTRQRQAPRPYDLEQPPTAFDRPQADFSGIVPDEDESGGGLFGLGGVTKLIEPAFGGPIDQPWDALRPIARLFEAEQKYISGPLARATYSHLAKPGLERLIAGPDVLPEYDRLPEPIRFAAENLLSPTTWIAPGALMKAARSVPFLARSIPTLGAQALATGSRRGLYKILEQEVVRASIPGTIGASIAAPFTASALADLGVPNLVGQGIGGIAGYSLGARGFPRPDSVGDLKSGDVLQVMNPEDMRVYHGTYSNFEGLPDTAHPNAKRRFASSATKGIYFTTDPEIAAIYANKTFDPEPGKHPRSGSRIIPAVLKKDTKYFDPEQDYWPNIELPNGWRTAEVKNAYQWYKRGASGSSASFFADELWERTGQQGLDSFLDGLAKAGYQAIKTGEEVIVMDRSALRPLYTFDDAAKYITEGSGSADANYQRLRDSVRAEYDRIMTEQERTPGLSFEAGPGPRSDRQLVSELQDSVDIVSLTRKLRAGAGTPDDILRAQELLAKYDVGHGGIGGTGSIVNEEPIPEDVRRIAFGEVPEGTPTGTRPIDEQSARMETHISGRASIGAASWDDARLQKEFADLERRYRLHQEPLKPGTIQAAESVREAVERSLTRQLTEVMGEMRRRGLMGGRRPPTVAGGSVSPTPIMDIWNRVNALPDAMLRADTVDDVYADFGARNSLTQMGRSFLNDNAPDWLKQYLNRRGIRLLDDGASHIIQGYNRLTGMGQGQASAAGDIIRQGITKLEQSDILQRTGAADWEDLFRNIKTYLPQLAPSEIAIIRTIHDPVWRAIETAEAFGVKNVPSPNPRNGLYVSIQPAEERPIARRRGGRQPSTRPERFLTTGEYRAAGIKLRDFASAQQAFVAQMMKASADNWLREAIKPFSASISELIPRQTRDDIANVGRLRNKLDAFNAELSRAVQTGQWRPVRNVPPELQQYAAEAATGQTLRRRADRVAEFRAIRQRLVPVAQTLRQRRSQLAQELQTARGLIERSGGTDRFPVEVNRRYFTESAGRQLQALDQVPAGDLITRFNNVIRPLMATLDVSFLGIQGLMGLSRNPKAYLAAVTQAFSSDAYETRLKQHIDSGLLDTFLKSDGVYLARNDIGEFLFPNVATRIPVLGPAFDTSNLLYTRFGNALRLELFEAGLPLATDVNSRRALARSASLATGYSPNPATRAETLAMFAPRFFRSQLGLLSDAITTGSATGATPFGQALGGRAQQLSRDEARKMLRNLVIGGTAVTVMANELAGEETDFDPRSPNFMRMRVAGHDVSVFGPWDTLLRAITETYKDGIDPAAGLEYLARAKASPALSRLFDMAYGETFTGNEVNFDTQADTVNSMLAFLQQSALPISLQQPVQEIATGGNIPEALLSGGIEITGTKSSPITDRERRDIISMDRFGNRWRDLEPYQREQLQREGVRVAAFSEDDTAMEIRRAISNRFSDEQAALDASLPPGPDWVEKYQELTRRRSGAFEQWEIEHSSTATNLAERTANRQLTPNQQALENYYGLFRTAREQSWTADEITSALSNLEASWTGDQAAYVKRNTGLRDTPTVKEYKSALDTLQPYFDIERQVWDRLAQRRNMPATSFDEYITSEVQRLRANGTPEPLIRYRVERLPLVRQFGSTVTQLKERYRRVHRDADSLLVKWYGLTPIRLQR